MNTINLLRKYGKSILLLVFTLQACWLGAQQLPAYSQYTFNKFLLNPGAAGSDGYTTINLVAREQWVGLEGTPKTHAITIDSRLLRNSFISKNVSVRKKKRLSSRSGRVGYAHAFNDRGTARPPVEGTYAYHLRLSDSSYPSGCRACLPVQTEQGQGDPG
jgi:type IX secretion system PorP/SprF family membrane protein